MTILFEQVRSNKDASEGRDKDRIAGRDLPDLRAGCLLQIVSRYISDCLQLYCRLFTGHLQVICSSNISMLVLLNFRCSKKNAQPTDRRMDWRTDGQTHVEMRGRI